MDTINNRLHEVRNGRGISAAELARRAGTSRQTIYAIESGSFVPNTEVALRLARELEVSVEELFSLAQAAAGNAQTLHADVLSATSAPKGQAVRVARIGTRFVSVPVNATPYFLPEADGIVAKQGKTQADLMVFASDDSFGNRLMLAGCDPAIGLLSRAVERLSGVEIVSAAASSRLALRWLAEGKVHIAGMHLKDPQTGEFNLPILRREYPGEDFAVITFAKWEEGFVTAAGNPKKIRNPEHLARRGVRFINRENGSGSRALLDQLLKSAGVDPRQVSGYDRIAYGHLAAASAVFSQDADCCVATQSAAQTFGLGFVPLESERYDFVVRRRLLDTPGVQNFLDALQRATLRRKLEGLAGYDTAQTGAVLA